MARMSFRVAPGVRMSVSSRGVRTSIGNSSARVSFGGGAAYTSARVAGVRVSQYHSNPRSTLGQLERANQAATLDEQLVHLAELERRLVTLHHEAFDPAVPRSLPAPAATDISSLSMQMQKAATKGIGVFKRADRREARVRAHSAAVELGRQQDVANAEAHALEVGLAQSEWQRLISHDPETVMAALEAAFADNASESTCVDVGADAGGRYATVVILVGPGTIVPDRTPAFTPTGRPTAKRRTKSERNALYVDALGSSVLATVREAFAVAPSVDTARIVVLRRYPDATTPSEFLTAIYLAAFRRAQMDHANWTMLDPGAALLVAEDAQFKRKGAAADVVSLDVTADEQIAQMLTTFRSALNQPTTA